MVLTEVGRPSGENGSTAGKECRGLRGNEESRSYWEGCVKRLGRCGRGVENMWKSYRGTETFARDCRLSEGKEEEDKEN